MILHSLEWLKIDFMQKALLGSTIISIASGLLGLFVVLKRIVFISMSLAEVSSAAVALAFLLGTNPSLTAVVITLVATFVLAFASRRTNRFPPEALIAIVYMFASSMAILMIAKNPAGEVDLMNVLFGNILTVNDHQLWESVWVAVPTVAFILFFFRFFVFTSFDPEMASTIGVSTSFWQASFYLMLGAVIVVGIRMSGALLTFSYLVIPAYCGLRISKKMKWVAAWSVVIGPTATFLGLWISFAHDLPTGPTITAVLVAIAGANLGLAQIKEQLW
jgi:zinc transport system permease protein